jgi:hypothetical protein
MPFSIKDHFILDEDGEPILAKDLAQWALFLNDFEKRHVAITEFTDPAIRISTVFLGINHQHGVGPPLLFETWAEGAVDDQIRVSSWEEAIQVHRDIVAQMRNGYPSASLLSSYEQPKPQRNILRTTTWEKLLDDDLQGPHSHEIMGVDSPRGLVEGICRVTDGTLDLDSPNKPDRKPRGSGRRRR